MTKYIIKSLTALSAILIIFAAADSATAQRRESRGRLLNKSQVNAIVNRVEDRVDNFKKNVDRSLDRSRLDGSKREDWINKRAQDLERATDELRREFDRRDSWAENKDEVRKCLNIATDIDRNMRRYKLGAATESNWERVRFELNTLADVYNLPKVGGNAYR